MTALLLRRPQPPDRHAEQAIIDFQGETSEVIGQPDPAFARSTVWALTAMVVALVVMMAVMHLDKVVATRGRVISQAPTILVQPLDLAIIRSLNVREGQVVRKGEVLATLDPTFSSADVAQLENQEVSRAAEIARLEAEAERRPYTTPADASPEVALQASVWQHRQAEHAARLANFDQRIATVEALIRRSRNDVEHFRARLEILGEIEMMRRTLARNETGSRLNLLIASDTRVETERNLSLSESTILTASHDLEAIRAERDVFIQQWRSNVLTELAERRVDLERIREELSKARKRYDLVDLRAIEDAVVLEVGNFSVGSVVQPAQTIVSLVKLDAPLEVEAEINAIDQGYVKLGDEVQIKFDAYRFMVHGMAKGVVRSISEDSFTRRADQSPAPFPFYRARVELREVDLRHVPDDFRLVPGMPVSAEIVVGRRTIISYLLESAMKNVAEGMREP